MKYVALIVLAFVGYVAIYSEIKAQETDRQIKSARANLVLLEACSEPAKYIAFDAVQKTKTMRCGNGIVITIKDLGP